MARIVAGDERAFMEAYDRHADSLYGIVTRLLGDREAAAEIVQETYLTLWQRASLFDEAAGSLGGWLMRIARNRSIDRLRSDARRPQLVHVASGFDVDQGWPGVEGPTANDPERVLERRWTRAVVMTALSGVPAAEREVLILAYEQGLSQSEIASRLAMPIGTVKSRTRRAMARMRETLAEIPGLTDDGEGRADDGPR